MEKIFLKSGELLFTNKPMLATTVLGSCVSVTMFHPPSQVAAMCHVLLPKCHEKKKCDPERCNTPFKFAHCAISEMLSKFNELGIPKSEIQVKLFGGASNFETFSVGVGVKSVGEQNVEMAVKSLMSLGIEIQVADIRGERGRKIIFNTSNGSVLLKTIDKTFPSEKKTAKGGGGQVVLRNIRHLRDFQID